ncbi:MAG: 2,3-bisphosphoglycerate-independent phosphoglycerate mutase [Candidatus Beckwithbacteria bacterium]
MDKVFLVIGDGIGDRPIASLGRKTPLEAARTPNLDKLAQLGISGAMHTIDVGVRPGSDTAHLALLGYDPNVYYTGRGPFEAAGLNMPIEQGDVCFRANMATVDGKITVIDRRAGRIEDTSEFAERFNGIMIDKVKFLLKKGTGHRIGLMMRGKNLSANITDVDPHKTGVKVNQAKPKDKTKEAKLTAQVLNKFLKLTRQKLQKLNSNKKRMKQGLLAANYILVRGAGKAPSLPDFKDKYGLKAACIAGAGLYKGIGRLIGMKVIEVKGATGRPDSDLKAKIRKAIELKEKYDFFFIHFKAADSLGEDGNAAGKIKFIEKIDEAIKPLIKLKNSLIVVTADHSTPCGLKNHSGDDVPIVIKSPQVRDDEVEHFNERECAKGRLGHIKGSQLMPIIIDLMGLAEMFGA